MFVKVLGWLGDVNEIDRTITTGDTTPPATPRLIIPASISKEKLLSVKGYAEPGAKVELYVNSQLVKEVVSESNGQFLATDLLLQSGSNQLYVVAVDSAGNRSTDSRMETVHYDNTPPKLTVESPVDGTEFKSDKRTIEVRGSTEEDARVWINERLVIMGAEGSFIHSMSLVDGDQVIAVKAVDPAGNETVEEITVTYTP